MMELAIWHLNEWEFRGSLNRRHHWLHTCIVGLYIMIYILYDHDIMQFESIRLLQYLVQGRIQTFFEEGSALHSTRSR